MVGTSIRKIKKKKKVLSDKWSFLSTKYMLWKHDISHYKIKVIKTKLKYCSELFVSMNYSLSSQFIEFTATLIWSNSSIQWPVRLRLAVLPVDCRCSKVTIFFSVFMYSVFFSVFMVQFLSLMYSQFLYYCERSRQDFRRLYQHPADLSLHKFYIDYSFCFPLCYAKGHGRSHSGQL